MLALEVAAAGGCLNDEASLGLRPASKFEETLSLRSTAVLFNEGSLLSPRDLDAPTPSDRCWCARTLSLSFRAQMGPVARAAEGEVQAEEEEASAVGLSDAAEVAAMLLAINGLRGVDRVWLASAAALLSSTTCGGPSAATLQTGPLRPLHEATGEGGADTEVECDWGEKGPPCRDELLPPVLPLP